MENSLNDELLCSLKDELREVTAQINVHSEKLMDLLDQKKESSVNSDHYIRCRYGHRYGNCAGTKQGKYRAIITAGTGSSARSHCAETVFKHCDVPDNDFAGFCIQ